MSNRNNDSRSSAGGIGFCGILTIAFIVLKLCHVIDWAWIWVLSPLWISLTLSMTIVIVAVVVSTMSDKHKNFR